MKIEIWELEYGNWNMGIEIWELEYHLLSVSKKSRTPKSAQTSAPPPPPRVPGAQGGSLDGRGWIYAPGADWGAHYCQLTALTGPRGAAGYSAYIWGSQYRPLRGLPGLSGAPISP